MNEATREMTFDEEYSILLKEAEELFSQETKGDEPPLSNCVVRRALRCINKLKDGHEEAAAGSLNADEEQLKKYYKDSCLFNIDLVRELGERIGYGAMMSYASALWRHSLVHDHKLVDGLGAFVPRITTELSDEEIMFDQWIAKYYSDVEKAYGRKEQDMKKKKLGLI